MRKRCFNPLAPELMQSVRPDDADAQAARLEPWFAKIDRLIEYRKGIVIRQYNRGLAFDLAVRYIACKAFGQDARYADTAAALAAIERLRFETILNLDENNRLRADDELPEKLKAVSKSITALPLVISMIDSGKNPGLAATAEAFPDVPFYLLMSDSMYLCGSEGFAHRHALEYRGVYFCDGHMYHAKFPSNLYIMMVADGYYSHGEGCEIFPSMLIRPDPLQIADPQKRSLHGIVNDLITAETGCPAFLLGETPYMCPGPLEETIDMALNAVYTKIRDFINEGNRKITTYDAIMAKLRKRVAEEFGLPAVARL